MDCHAVQLCENESFVHHSIAEFFAQHSRPSDPLNLVSVREPTCTSRSIQRLSQTRSNKPFNEMFSQFRRFSDGSTASPVLCTSRWERADGRTTPLSRSERNAHPTGFIRRLLPAMSAPAVNPPAQPGASPARPAARPRYRHF